MMPEKPNQQPQAHEGDERSSYAELSNELKREVDRLEDALQNVQDQIRKLDAEGLLSEESKSSSLDYVEEIMRKVEASQQQEVSNTLKYIESKIAPAADIWEKRGRQLEQVSILVGDYDDLVLECRSLAQTLPEKESALKSSIEKSARVGTRTLEEDILVNLDQKELSQVTEKLQQGIDFWKEKQHLLSDTLTPIQKTKKAPDQPKKTLLDQQEWQTLQKSLKGLAPAAAIQLLEEFAGNHTDILETTQIRNEAFKYLVQLFNSTVQDREIVVVEKETGDRFIGRVHPTRTNDSVLVLLMEKDGKIVSEPFLRSALEERGYADKPVESEKYNTMRKHIQSQLGAHNIASLQKLADLCDELSFGLEKNSVEHVMRTVSQAPNVFGEKEIEAMKQNKLTDDEKKDLLGGKSEVAEFNVASSEKQFFSGGFFNIAPEKIAKLRVKDQESVSRENFEKLKQFSDLELDDEYVFLRNILRQFKDQDVPAEQKGEFHAWKQVIENLWVEAAGNEFHFLIDDSRTPESLQVLGLIEPLKLKQKNVAYHGNVYKSELPYNEALGMLMNSLKSFVESCGKEMPTSQITATLWPIEVSEDRPQVSLNELANEEKRTIHLKDSERFVIRDIPIPKHNISLENDTSGRLNHQYNGLEPFRTKSISSKGRSIYYAQTENFYASFETAKLATQTNAKEIKIGGRMNEFDILVHSSRIVAPKSALLVDDTLSYRYQNGVSISAERKGGNIILTVRGGDVDVELEKIVKTEEFSRSRKGEETDRLNTIFRMRVVNVKKG